jgi:hypothetical protein
MGVITDSIVADKKHAMKICLKRYSEQSKKFHSEEIRGLDDSRLDALFSIVRDGSIKNSKVHIMCS